MTNMTNFTEIITAGLNNPDCAFYTGAFIGKYEGFHIAVVFLIIVLLYNIVNKLAIEPLFEWLKKIIWRGRKK